MKNLFIILIITLAFACTKKVDDDRELAVEPSIVFVSITPDSAENFKNSILLKVNFTDNNGDIGSNDPDKFTLWVKDGRLDSADFYHVPPQSPIGKNIIVHGTLDIVLNSMFLLGNGNEEVVSLSIKLQDRAGHWSNIVHSTPITIYR